MARQARQLEERFWAKVDKSGECWLWTDALRPDGYGYLQRVGGRGGRTYLAHRASYEIAYGPIPDGLHVCHHCDNPPCVRPDHLFLGTDLDNIRDMIRKGRGRYVRGDLNGTRKHPETRPRGSRNAQSRLTESDVPIIRSLLAKGIRQVDIAAQFGISHQVVSTIKLRQAWAHVP